MTRRAGHGIAVVFMVRNSGGQEHKGVKTQGGHDAVMSHDQINILVRRQ